jgi:hypothetical protein
LADAQISAAPAPGANRDARELRRTREEHSARIAAPRLWVKEPIHRLIVADALHASPLPFTPVRRRPPTGRTDDAMVNVDPAAAR